MSPDHAALLVHHRIPSMMNTLYNKVVTQLELRQAIQGKSVDRVRRFIRRPWNIRRMRAFFNAVAIVRKRIGARAVNSLAIVLLQAGEIAVRDREHLLAREPLRWRNRLEPHIFGLVSRLVHVRDIGRTAATLPEIDAFNFRNTAKLDT